MFLSALVNAESSSEVIPINVETTSETGNDSPNVNTTPTLIAKLMQNTRRPTRRERLNVAYVGACLGTILIALVVVNLPYNVNPTTVVVILWGLIYIAEGAIAGYISGIRLVTIITAFSGAFVGLFIAGLLSSNGNIFLAFFCGPTGAILGAIANSIRDKL